MAELDDLINAWTATVPTAKLLAWLEDHGIPAGLDTILAGIAARAAAQR